MSDKVYYNMMTILAWIAIGLGLVSVVLWTLGLYPDLQWSDLDSPLAWLSILFMIKIMRQKDELIQELTRKINRG